MIFLNNIFLELTFLLASLQNEEHWLIKHRACELCRAPSRSRAVYFIIICGTGIHFKILKSLLIKTHQYLDGARCVTGRGWWQPGPLYTGLRGAIVRWGARQCLLSNVDWMCLFARHSTLPGAHYCRGQWPSWDMSRYRVQCRYT